MAETSTSQIAVDEIQISSSRTDADKSSPDPQQTPTINDIRPLEHVPEDDPDLKLKQENTELKVELAKLKEEHMNLKQWLKKKERDLRDAKVLLAEVVIEGAKQDAELQSELDEQEAMLASLQGSAQLRIEEPSSKRARSSPLEDYLENSSSFRSPMSSYLDALPSYYTPSTALASSASTSSFSSAGPSTVPASSSSSSKGKEKAVASSSTDALGSYFSNQHSMSRADQIAMLDNIIKGFKKEGIRPSADI